MDESQKTQTTNTQTTQTDLGGNTENESGLYLIYPVVFVKFAEYVGYVSELLKWCDEWVSGKDIEPFKKKAIEIDAQNIYKQMLKDMGAKAIREYYEAFYEVILFEWDDAIEKLEHKPSKT